MFSFLLKLPSFLWGKEPVAGASQVFDQIDPGCQMMLCRNRKLAAALNQLGERLKSHPEIHRVHLEHVVDPESGWQQLFVRSSTSLSLDDAMKLEDEVVNSISQAQWSLFKNVCITIEETPDD